jgi:hypothetical protein
MQIKELEINVLEYILKAIPKKLRHNSIKAFFSDGGDVEIGFDVKDEELMDDLQKIADYDEHVLSGDGVYVEIKIDESYEGFTLFGNYDDDDEADGNTFFDVDKDGIVFDVNYD